MPRRPLRCDLSDPRLEHGFARVRQELDVPEAFPDAVIAEAEESAAVGPMMPPGANDDVRDALHIPFAAIDPPGSTDLDQAYAAERRSEGYRVFYAIADVAALVKPEGAIDMEARSRGVTLYSPDLRTSLHPEVINEGAGSLLEDQLRRALLWTIDLDSDGEIESAHLERADVRTRAQLSYRIAQDQIADLDRDHPLALLREIGELRIEREADRGAVSLQLPSQEIQRHPDGYELIFDESLPIENWNAQISLLTGIAASRIMIDAGIGLLRTLPPPEKRTLRQLRLTAKALAIDWPAHYGYDDQVRGMAPDTPETSAFLAQAASGLRGAGYVAFFDGDLPEQNAHSAIASTYAHVTAPLRRLCDRFANEALLASCADKPVPEWAAAGMAEMPSLMGRARQKDRSLERTMVDFMEAVVLESRVGQEFRGVITDVDDDRSRIQLREPAVVTTLEGKGYELGAEIDVVLVEADVEGRRVVFERAAT